MAHVRRSLEMEPRTMNELQLSCVREAAFDMINKKETNEALKTIVEGLTTPDVVEVVSRNENDEEDQNIIVDKKKKWNTPTHTSCSCGSSATTTTTTTTTNTDNSAIAIIIIDESPDNFVTREPLSAPF